MQRPDRNGTLADTTKYLRLRTKHRVKATSRWNWGPSFVTVTILETGVEIHDGSLHERARSHIPNWPYSRGRGKPQEGNLQKEWGPIALTDTILEAGDEAQGEGNLQIKLGSQLSHWHYTWGWVEIHEGASMKEVGTIAITDTIPEAGVKLKKVTSSKNQGPSSPTDTIPVTGVEAHESNLRK